MKRTFKSFLFCLLTVVAYCQMKVNNTILVGNEWIDFNATYYKIKVASDGIYKVSGKTLLDHGIDITKIKGSQLQLWQGGKEQAISVSTDNNLVPTDYFEFFGERNKLQLDSFLYKNWRSELLNTDFALFSDTTTYFLTIVPSSTTTKRMNNSSPDYKNINIPETNYYFHREKLTYKNQYYTPTYEGTNKLKYSNFNAIEGYSYGPAETTTSQIETSNINLSTSRSPELRLRFGLNQVFNQVEISFNGQKISSLTKSGKASVIDTTLLLDKVQGTNNIEIKSVAVASDDRHLLANVELWYPRNFELKDKLDQIRIEKGKTLFRYKGIGSNTDIIYGWSTKNNLKVKSGIKNNEKILFFDLKEYEDIIVYTEKDVKELKELTKKQFKKIEPQSESDYLMITSAAFKKKQGVTETIEEYKKYRQSSEGGGYKVKEIEVEEIFDQFGYGHDKHLYSFKNYNHFLRSNLPKIKFILLVGKGRAYYSWRQIFLDTDNESLYIPSYGDYPSDEVLFTKDDETYSGYRIGRIAAENKNDLETYLNKVKEYENFKDDEQSITGKFWRKNILHLSGGGNPYEQNRIKNYLKQMEKEVDKPSYGAIVNTYFKESTDPIEDPVSVKIRDLINHGLGYITFFGHSSPGSWDINVEEPTKWENKGRYPIVISLGCLSGNIHAQYKGIGERYLFIKDKGSIAFIASSGSAILDPQGLLGVQFYNEIGTKSYGKTIGDMLASVKENHSTIVNLGYYSLNQQLTLLGDPAVKLFGAEKPDFTPDGNSVKTIPEVVSSGDKNFDLIFDVYNLGRAINDSMQIRIIFENLDSKDIDTLVYTRLCPTSKQEMKLTIPNKGINALGRNRIQVYVDYLNKIQEAPEPVAENNNELKTASNEDFTFYVLDNTAKPIFPPEYGILNDKNKDFRVATSNAFAIESNYIIQIDTSELFNSPSFKSIIIKSKGGTFTFKPDINFENERVYYWRVSPDSINSDLGFTWINSSFVYLENSSEGWNQSHYYQYKHNPFNFINIDTDRKFKFSNRIRTIEILNGKYIADVHGYKVDNSNFAASIKPWTFMGEGMAVSLINPLTSLHEGKSGGHNGKYGSIVTAAKGSDFCFGFDTKTKQGRKAMMDLLKNEVPDGWYVCVWSVYGSSSVDFKFNEWAADSIEFGENLFSVLEQRGAKEVRGLKNKKLLPYTFIYKNKENTISERIGKDEFETINNRFEFGYPGNNGETESVLIGPVAKWEKVLWKTILPETKDTALLYVIGVLANGTEETIKGPITNNQDIDLSDVNAKKYPYIKIDYKVVDLVNRTVPNLVYWRVVAKPLPDGEIAPDIAFSIPDSVQQGDPILLRIGMKNATSTDMNNLLVKYTLSSIGNITNATRVGDLKAVNNLIYEGTIDSRNLKGEYNLSFELNPDNDQPESEKFNNLGQKKIKVIPDRINPFLKVHFDGYSIMDGDIVAPKPLIEIKLTDENKYLLLNKPEDIVIIITDEKSNEKEYTLSSPDFKFVPASNSQDNTATITINPMLEEGKYTLTVRGSDISGNQSGTTAYQVNFLVVKENKISNVLNYPNPFSTQTKFLFTLTGSIPDDITIRIMTLSGKIVKEITREEIGTLKIGNNITQYAWNGTDDFGNRLANGVYLYQVKVKDSSLKDFELYERAETDKLFTKGFGKLVILR